MNKKKLFIWTLALTTALYFGNSTTQIQEDNDIQIAYKSQCGKVNTLTNFIHKNFDAHTAFANATKYDKVVVDFYAPWCGPCKRMAPQFEEFAQQYPDVLFIKINIEEFEGISSKFNIRSIPAVLYFQNGNHTGSTIGYNPADVKNNIEQLLAK